MSSSSYAEFDLSSEKNNIFKEREFFLFLQLELLLSRLNDLVFKINPE